MQLNCFIFWVLFVLNKEAKCIQWFETYDETMSIYSKGIDLVNAAMQKVNYFAESFSAPNHFWRRIALAESNAGMDPGYNVEDGVWRFFQSGEPVTSGTASDQTQETDARFIEKSEAAFDMCYSCLGNRSVPILSAVYSKAQLLYRGGPYSGNVSAQGFWWVNTYQTLTALERTEEFFVERALTYDIEYGCRNDLKIDVWFLLDSSLSVSDVEFQASLDFLYSVAYNFSGPSSRIRFGYSIYFHNHSIEFQFEDYINLASLRASLDGVSRPVYSTQTGSALRRVVTDGFNESAGARSDAMRILVVVTSGSAGDDISGPIKQLKEEDDIIIYCFGTGGKVNQTQLNEIASRPTDKHLFERDTLDEMDESSFMIARRTQVCYDLVAASVYAWMKNELKDRPSNYTDADDLLAATRTQFSFSCFPCSDTSGLRIQEDVENIFSQNNKVIGGSYGLNLQENLILWLDFHDQSCFNNHKLDMWFLLDNVENYTNEEYMSAINFMEKLVDEVNNWISHSERLRVGYSVSYAWEHEIFMRLEETTSYAAFTRITGYAAKPESRGYIGKAIRAIDDNWFGSSSGARIDDNEVGRFLIMLLDGSSHDDFVTPATEIQDKNVTIISIGIGNEINLTALKEINSVNSYLSKTIPTFDSLASLTKTIVAVVHRQMYDTVCNLHINLPLNVEVIVPLTNGRRRHLETQILEDRVLVIQFESTANVNGKGYMSGIISEPNSAYYDFALDLVQGIEIMWIKGSSLLERYPSLSGTNPNNSSDNWLNFYISVVNGGDMDFVVKIFAYLILEEDLESTTPRLLTSTASNVSSSNGQQSPSNVSDQPISEETTQNGQVSGENGTDNTGNSDQQILLDDQGNPMNGNQSTALDENRNPITTNIYDENGNPTNIFDENGNQITAISFNENGSQIMTSIFDESGNPITTSIFDENGTEITTNSFDENGNPINGDIGGNDGNETHYANGTLTQFGLQTRDGDETSDTLGSKDFQTASDMSWIIPIIAALLLGISGILFFLYKRKKKRQKIHAENAEETTQNVEEHIYEGGEDVKNMKSSAIQKTSPFLNSVNETENTPLSNKPVSTAVAESAAEKLANDIVTGVLSGFFMPVVVKKSESEEENVNAHPSQQTSDVTREDKSDSQNVNVSQDLTETEDRIKNMDLKHSISPSLTSNSKASQKSPEIHEKLTDEAELDNKTGAGMGTDDKKDSLNTFTPVLSDLSVVENKNIIDIENTKEKSLASEISDDADANKHNAFLATPSPRLNNVPFSNKTDTLLDLNPANQPITAPIVSEVEEAADMPSFLANRVSGDEKSSESEAVSAPITDLNVFDQQKTETSEVPLFANKVSDDEKPSEDETVTAPITDLNLLVEQQTEINEIPLSENQQPSENADDSVHTTLSEKQDNRPDSASDNIFTEPTLENQYTPEKLDKEIEVSIDTSVFINSADVIGDDHSANNENKVTTTSPVSKASVDEELTRNKSKSSLLNDADEQNESQLKDNFESTVLEDKNIYNEEREEQKDDMVIQPDESSPQEETEPASTTIKEKSVMGSVVQSSRRRSSLLPDIKLGLLSGGKRRDSVLGGRRRNSLFVQPSEKVLGGGQRKSNEEEFFRELSNTEHVCYSEKEKFTTKEGSEASGKRNKLAHGISTKMDDLIDNLNNDAIPMTQLIAMRNEIAASLEEFKRSFGSEPIPPKALKYIEAVQRKLIDITLYILTLRLTRAIHMRDGTKLQVGLDAVSTALTESQVSQADVDGCVALSANIKRAKDLLSLFEQLERMKSVVMSLKQTTISEVRSYSNPPDAIRKVMEATYILLGEEHDKIKSWKLVQGLIGRTGKGAIKRRVLERNVVDISFADAQAANDLVKDLVIEEVEIVSKAAAVFFTWVLSVEGEVRDRLAGLGGQE